MNFAFINIFYINNVSFDVDNVKTINGTFPLTIIAEDIANYGLEVFLSHLKILNHGLYSSELSYIGRVLNFSKLFFSIFKTFSLFLQSSKQII